MPKADVLGNKEVYRYPKGGDSMSNNTTNNNCNCGCQDNTNTNNNSGNVYPAPGYWQPCPPPPYPYPYDCPPVNPGVGSTEMQIAKLSKKSATIRKMIDNLVNKNKAIIIQLGCGASYNFGTYLNADKEETDYGKAVLEMLQAELEAIKAKIIELTGDLEVQDESSGGVEETVTASSTSSL